ncbi:hypothetical protein HID58_087163, partial [Brassica napus]
VFPLTPVSLPEEDSLAAIQSIQSDLLQAMSQMFHLGERMDDHASIKGLIWLLWLPSCARRRISFWPRRKRSRL